MDELENKNFEPEFLNVLNESESTLILGTSSDEGCTSYCDTYDPTCRAFKCNTNTCTCNGTCYNDGCSSDSCSCDPKYCETDGCSCYMPRGSCYEDFPTGTTYYWWAGGVIDRFGYYLDSITDIYKIYSGRSKFTSTISASSASYSAICKTITANSGNVSRIADYGSLGKVKFYTSGTGTTIVGSTSNEEVIGYIFVNSSATTHMTGGDYIRVFARSTSSHTYFNSMWSYITGSNYNYPSSTYAHRPEKRFTIDVYSGTHLVQGAKFNINNVATIFPQFGTVAIKQEIRTGTGGRVCLCTSSTTSTAITGTVSRKGLYGGQAKAFTASQNVITSVQLTGNTASTDAETVVVENANEINPEGVYEAFQVTEKKLNLTKKMLAEKYYSSTTFNNQDTTAYGRVVLRFNATKKNRAWFHILF